MKSILSRALITVMMLSMIAVPLAMAEETVTLGSIETTDAEINEALDVSLNEDVGSVKIGWRTVQLWFTFNQEKKADRELDLARLRLIQAKVAAQNGDDEAMAKAIEAHNKLVERVKERVPAMDGASDEKGIKNSAAKLVRLEIAVQVHEARIGRLNDVLLANENLTAEQKAKIRAHISHAEEVTAKLAEVQTAKMEQVKTRLMAVADMSEEEADNTVEELDVKVDELPNKIQERTEKRVQSGLSNSSGNTEEVQTATRTQSAGESTRVQTETAAQTAAGKA